ncbi:MAG: adenylate/guanylate cyclase domain-containing protein [Nevskia sp.]|nr:adenylate/guanylate cyclase domain-containing protein [Nevskia sp.]
MSAAGWCRLPDVNDPHATGPAPTAAAAQQLHGAAALDAVLAGPPGELQIGVTGHLLLSGAEEHNVVRRLRGEVLPQLLPPGWSRPVCLLTGLAPGSDLLFTRTASAWLGERGIPHRVVGLLPVPLDTLLQDWLDNLRATGEQVPAPQLQQRRAEIEDTLAGCAAVVQLMPASAGAAELRSDTFRQRQYQQLGACLSQRCEVLVAILREDNAVRPGGTAEVVHWRRNPQSMPPELSTTPDPRRRLIVVDPARDEAAAGGSAATPGSAPAGLALRAEEALRAGNYVLCHDLATRAARAGQPGLRDGPRLQYLSLLALANAGSADLAWRRYGALGLSEAELDEDWLALKGRLLKDRALVSGQPSDFEQAALAYLAAYERTGGHFAAVNAASMFALAGARTRAQALAQEVLRITGDAAEAAVADELGRYYLAASAAEAALLGGDTQRCRLSLRRADRLEPANANARSRTRAQIRLLCRHLGIEDRFSAMLRLPPLMYLARSAEQLAEVGATAATPDGAERIDALDAQVFAPLLRPADLLAVEHFLRRGARLRLVLPASPEAVAARWQRSFGADWANRLSACLQQVSELTALQGFLEPELQWAERYVAAIAAGLARLAARQLGGACRRIEVAAAEAGGVALRETDDDGGILAPALHAAPAAREFGTQRRFVGLLFADIAGFRRLPDDEMPRFWSQVMGSVALILAAHGDKVLFRHTWGDAINVVTEDARTAAEIALALRDCIDEVRRSESGMLGRIDLRIAAHFAPAYAGFDPIENVPNYYGSQLSLTARVEPVTPPGMIFVTEPFAASLALEAPDRFALHYAGEIELAKNFGKYRLFNLAQN